MDDRQEIVVNLAEFQFPKFNDRDCTPGEFARRVQRYTKRLQAVSDRVQKAAKKRLPGGRVVVAHYYGYGPVSVIVDQHRKETPQERNRRVREEKRWVKLHRQKIKDRIKNDLARKERVSPGIVDEIVEEFKKENTKK